MVRMYLASAQGSSESVRYQSMPKRSRQSHTRKKAANREQLIVWLTHYNNRFGSSGREGLINLQALPKPGPSWGPLDYGENVDRIETWDQYETDKTLAKIIENLRKEKWPLYMILQRPYLDPDGSPAIVEKWRIGAEAGGVGEKIQYKMHEEAINWILDNLPDDHVIVVNPRYQVATGDIDAARQRRRQRARLKFFSYEAEYGTEQAVKKVADEIGYSRKEVYKIIADRPKKKKKKK